MAGGALSERGEAQGGSATTADEDAIARGFFEVHGATIDAATRAKLSRMWHEAKAAWPALDVSAEAFGRTLAACAAADGADLDAIRAADLYVASACAAGDPRAAHAFEETFGPGLDRGLARFAGKAISTDDLGQLVRAKLFVGEGSPKIAQYRGRGELRVWLRVLATRTALNALRSPTSEELDDHLAATIVDPNDSPELLHMKSVYRDEFKTAFSDALRELSPRQKSLLRFAVLNGLDGGRVATIYGVHRTTASRWIDEAQRQLADRTMRLLADRLRVSSAEVKNILAIIRSHLELSLSRCFDEAS